jgi:hypothetical protein
MLQMTPAESVREWMRTWNEVDREGFFALLSPRFVGKGVMAPQGVDGEAIWQMMVAFRETFPDIRWELGDWLVVQGDLAVCHTSRRCCQRRAEARSSGRRVRH